MNIIYDEKDYNVDKRKVNYVLTKLGSSIPEDLSEEDILKFMKKYKLFDEVFLGKMQQFNTERD